MSAGHRSVCTLAVIALAGGTAAAQGRPDPRPQPRLEERIERTAEAVAAMIEANVERWAGQFERHADRWAETIERHAEELAERIEARVEAAGQTEAEREAQQRAREIQREAQQRAREIQREAQQRARQLQREAQERAREAQRERQRQRGRENPGNRNEVTESFSRTVRLDRGGVVDLENTAGDIIITGGGGSDVRIDAVKRMRGASEADAQARLRDLQIEIVERAGRLQVRTNHPRGRSGGGAVDYTLAVPAAADLVLRSVSGDVRVSNVRGELRAETINGDLEATSIGRIQLVKTISGNVTISGAEGDLNAESVNGDVVVRGLKGRSGQVSTVSGDVRMSDIELERANIGSINGDIDYGGRLARSGRYELHTHSGDVTVTPAGNAGFDVEANTFNGDITSQMTLKLSRDSERGPGRSINRAIRGTSGDAGAVLVLRTFNGDIRIVKR